MNNYFWLKLSVVFAATLFSVLYLLFGSRSSSKSTKIPQDVMLELSKEFMNEGSLDNALQALDIYESTNRCESECKLVACQIRYKQGNFLGALEACEQVSSNFESKCKAQLFIAKSLHGLNLLPRANIAYQSSVRCSSSSRLIDDAKHSFANRLLYEESLIGAARVLLLTNKSQESIDLISTQRQSLEFTSLSTVFANIAVKRVLADCLVASGKLVEAAKHFEAILVESPTDADIATALHSVYSSINDHKHALVVGRTFTRARPRSPRGHLLIALSLLALNRHTEAVVVCQVALSLQSDLPEAWQLLARAYASLGQVRYALTAYSRSLQLHQTSKSPSSGADLSESMALSLDLGKTLLQMEEYLQQEKAAILPSSMTATLPPATPSITGGTGLGSLSLLSTSTRADPNTNTNAPSAQAEFGVDGSKAVLYEAYVTLLEAVRLCELWAKSRRDAGMIAGNKGCSEAWQSLGEAQSRLGLAQDALLSLLETDGALTHAPVTASSTSAPAITDPNQVQAKVLPERQSVGRSDAAAALVDAWKTNLAPSSPNTVTALTASDRGVETPAIPLGGQREVTQASAPEVPQVRVEDRLSTPDPVEVPGTVSASADSVAGPGTAAATSQGLDKREPAESVSVSTELTSEDPTVPSLADVGAVEASSVHSEGLTGDDARPDPQTVSETEPTSIVNNTDLADERLDAVEEKAGTDVGPETAAHSAETTASTQSVAENIQTAEGLESSLGAVQASDTLVVAVTTTHMPETLDPTLAAIDAPVDPVEASGSSETETVSVEPSVKAPGTTEEVMAQEDERSIAVESSDAVPVDSTLVISSETTISSESSSDNLDLRQQGSNQTFTEVSVLATDSTAATEGAVIPEEADRAVVEAFGLSNVSHDTSASISKPAPENPALNVSSESQDSSVGSSLNVNTTSTLPEETESSQNVTTAAVPVQVPSAERRLADQYLKIATAYLGRGQYDLASKQLLKAYKKDPTYPETNILLAQTYGALGEASKALDSYLAVLQHDRCNGTVYKELGMLGYQFLQQRALSATIRALNPIHECNKTDTSIALLLASALANTGDDMKALEVLLPTNTPTYPMTRPRLQLMTGLLERTNRSEEAEAMWVAAIAANLSSWVDVGDMYVRQGKFQEAARSFERVLEQRSDGLLHRKLGLLYADKLNDTLAAHFHIGKAVDLGIMDAKIRKFYSQYPITLTSFQNDTRSTNESNTSNSLDSESSLLSQQNLRNSSSSISSSAAEESKTSAEAVPKLERAGFSRHRWIAKAREPAESAEKDTSSQASEAAAGGAMKAPGGSLRSQLGDVLQAAVVGEQEEAAPETAFEAMNRKLEEQSAQEEDSDSLGASYDPGSSSVLSSVLSSRRSR